MNDPPGVPSPFGIELVEWVAEGGENLTVRVTGRWRRRRPAWSAQPTLVIEAPGRRYRFPAMPEPPSLSGTPPGKWRISFAVPAALAPELGGRAWLQFGAVAVPLPAAVEPLGAAPVAAPVEAEPSAPEQSPSAVEPPPEADATAETTAEAAADTIANSPRPSSEVADEAERRRSAETDQAVAVAAAPVEQERLGIERALIARQAGDAPRVPTEPPAPAVAVAIAAEPAAESQTAGTAPSEQLLAALRVELEQRARSEVAVRARLVESETRVAARQLLGRQTAATLGQLREELEGLRGMLGHERGGRETAERHAEELARDLARLRLQTSEAYAAIAELRGVIEALRAVLPAVPPEVEPLPSDPPDASAAVDLPPSDPPQAPSTADPPPSEPAQPPPTVHAAPAADNPAAEAEPAQPPQTVHPAPAADNPAAEAEPAERLSEALVRLRDAIAPLEANAGERTASEPARAAAPAAPARVDRAWLRPVFTALAGTVPDRAGRLLVDLLPAQQAVDPTPVAYDLMLGRGEGCAQVTVDDPGSRVEFDDEPRSRKEVDFRVTGDYAALAKLMAASRLRRRFGWGLARVRGKRSRISALDALLDTRLSFAGLHAAGVRLHPRTALTVVAELIGPAWTYGVNFLIGYESPPEKAVYLVVAGGSPVAVSDAAGKGVVATTISGPAGSLELVLAGIEDAATIVIGADEPLILLREWINRAQSD